MAQIFRNSHAKKPTITLLNSDQTVKSALNKAESLKIEK